MMANRTRSTRACRVTSLIGLLGCTLAAGCGVSTTDLGSSATSGNDGAAVEPAVYATQAPPFGGQGDVGGAAAAAPAPFRIVDHAGFRDFWIQDDRLCWVQVDHAPDSTNRHSCDPQNCAATVQVIAPLSGRQNLFGFNVEDWPSRNRVQSNATWRRLLFEDNFAYYGAGSWITRCALADCSNTQEKIPLRPPVGDTWGEVSSESLVGLDAEYIYASDEQQIVRVQKNAPYVDSLGEYVEYETVVSEQTFSRVPQLHGDRLYWAPLNDAGDVVSCPKVGCVGAPTVLTPNLGFIIDFTVDGPFLFLLERAGADDLAERIVRCPISGCTDTTTEVKASGALGDQIFVHGDYVYFGGSEADRSGGYIAVVPK